MKSIVIAVAAILLTIALPFIYNSIDDAITDEYVQTFAGVSTAAGVYSANVTLGRDLFHDDAVSVTDITSNISADAPSAVTFNSVSRNLEINGLDQSQTRTMAVYFLIPSVNLASGMSTFLTLLRWFYLFILIGMAGGAVYAFFD